MLSFESVVKWDFPEDVEEAIAEAGLEFRYFLFPPLDENSSLGLERRAEYAEETGLGLCVNHLRHFDDASLFIFAALMEQERPVPVAIAMAILGTVSGCVQRQVKQLGGYFHDEPATLLDYLYRRYRHLDGEVDMADVSQFDTRDDVGCP